MEKTTLAQFNQVVRKKSPILVNVNLQKLQSSNVMKKNV